MGTKSRPISPGMAEAQSVHMQPGVHSALANPSDDLLELVDAGLGWGY